jgi:hypothetical protein
MSVQKSAREFDKGTELLVTYRELMKLTLKIHYQPKYKSVRTVRVWPILTAMERRSNGDRNKHSESK